MVGRNFRLKFRVKEGCMERIESQITKRSLDMKGSKAMRNLQRVVGSNNSFQEMIFQEKSNLWKKP